MSVPSPSNTTILPDEIISVQAFGDVLKLYAGILSLCSLVALINYHRLKFPLPISLSLSGLVMSIILVAIDSVIPNHPIRVYVQGLLLASDFDEVILRFGVGFIMFASAMESDLSSLRPKWGLIFLLAVCGVIISITLCALASLAIFIGFNYYLLPLSVIHILTPVLFGCVVAPTDAHHFVLEALQKNGAPESFSAIVVGEGLTNDALAVVAFSIVKTLVDSEYVRDEGGCDHILTQQECINFHMCEWDVPDTVGGAGGGAHRQHNLTTTATQVMSSLAGAVGSSENNHAHIEGSCVTGHMEIDVWSEIAKDVFGGVFIGVFLAWVFSSIMRRVRQPNINILLSITLVLDAIVVSDLLNSSPAVACAAAGLFLRAFGLKYIERRSLEELDIVWKFFEEALSGIFFLLIGLVIIIDKFDIKIFFASVIAIPVTLGARYCSVALPMWAWNFVSIPADKIPWSIVPAMTWGGIRGGSSVALALSLSPVEGRTTIFAMTYAVVLHSLIVQGLSVPKFFKNLFRIEGDTGNNHNNIHADNGQFAWLAAEKDGILDDLKHGMDTSPLLRQMLAEQGIAREHLDRVSDTQSNHSSSSSRHGGSYHGGSHAHSFNNSHNNSHNNSRNNSHKGDSSLPHSLTTSPHGAFGMSPPTHGPSHMLLPPGQSDQFAQQEQHRPPLSPDSRHHSGGSGGSNSQQYPYANLDANPSLMHQHSVGLYAARHHNRSGSNPGSTGSVASSLDGNESRRMIRNNSNNNNQGSRGSVYDHQWSSQTSQHGSTHSHHSTPTNQHTQLSRGFSNTMDGATNTLLPRNNVGSGGGYAQPSSSVPSMSPHYLAPYLPPSHTNGGTRNDSNESRSSSDNGSGTIHHPNSRWDTIRTNVFQGAYQQMHRPSSMDSGSNSESGGGGGRPSSMDSGSISGNEGSSQNSGSLPNLESPTKASSRNNSKNRSTGNRNNSNGSSSSKSNSSGSGKKRTRRNNRSKRTGKNKKTNSK